MKMQKPKLLIAGMLMVGIVGLLRSQPTLSQPSRPEQPNVSNNLRLSYQGSWTGTLQYVGFQGQMLLFIDPSGRLYGSFESDDGSKFAQISGNHRGNRFHMILTPPPGSSYQGEGSEPYTLDATATSEGVNGFVVSVEGHTGHTQSYIFERRVEPGT